MFELCALGCAFLWAISSFIVRSQCATMTPALMNAIRCAAAGVVFWLLLPFNASVADFAAISLPLLALLVGSVVVNIVLGDTLNLMSIRRIGLSRSMPLASTFPVTTIIVEYLLLGHAAGPDRSVLLLVLSGLIGMALGSYLFLAALQGLEASRAVTLLAVSPLFGMMLAVIFLKEKIGFNVIAGLVLCFAGVVAVF